MKQYSHSELLIWFAKVCACVCVCKRETAQGMGGLSIGISLHKRRIPAESENSSSYS